MEEKRRFSYLSGSNVPYIEELYEEYLGNPDSVDETWRQYFAALAQSGAGAKDVAHRPIRETFANLAGQRHAPAVSGSLSKHCWKNRLPCCA